MQIAIRNYVAGSYLLEQEPRQWDAIVVLDPRMSPTAFVAEHACRHLFLRFDDIASALPGKQPPTTDDVRAAIEFAATSDKLLVCCRAGQSRSAALAFLIAGKRLGADAAVQLLNPRRHIPNPLIVSLGAELIDDPSVLARFHQWQADHRHIKLADFYDEIEAEFDELMRRGARNRIVDE